MVEISEHCLDGFVLSVLDAKRGEVFKKTGNRAPAKSARIAVGGPDMAAMVRHSAIHAAVAMPRDQQTTFTSLASLISAGKDVTARVWDGVGHAFLADYRPSYSEPEAHELWTEIMAFFGRHLS